MACLFLFKVFDDLTVVETITKARRINNVKMRLRDTETKWSLHAFLVDSTYSPTKVLAALHTCPQQRNCLHHDPRHRKVPCRGWKPL